MNRKPHRQIVYNPVSGTASYQPRIRAPVNNQVVPNRAEVSAWIQSNNDKYKYRAVICRREKAVCVYCHLVINYHDLMLLTKSQMIQNESESSPCFYGYHCDCFFLSSNICNHVSEIQGCDQLSRYHFAYLSRKLFAKPVKNKKSVKLQNQSQVSVPLGIVVGYAIGNQDISYTCERCHLMLLSHELKIAGTLHSGLRVYHPRCFSEEYGTFPLTLSGLDDLDKSEQRSIRSMLNVQRVQKRPQQPAPAPKHPQFVVPAASTARPFRRSDPVQDRLWNELVSSQPNSHSFSTRPPQSDTSKTPDTCFTSAAGIKSENIPPPCNTPGHPSATNEESAAQKRKFKPCLRNDRRESESDTSPEKLAPSENAPLNSVTQPVPPIEEKDEAPRKVELKKSTIRSEITKILYKYNHDYITSKIVRTMLMEKFECDLTPHKKFIDDTIMELLDIIENNPINLKSIPGRIFVDEGNIDDDSSQASRSEKENTAVSPMRAVIDDISPFSIMGAQADEIENSNVDETVTERESARAWCDTSPNTKTSTNMSRSGNAREQDDENCSEKDTNQTYAISVDDKPINLCECCLCCFRVQTLEEITSLYNHINTKHKDARSCAVCGIKFPDVYKLMLHVAEFHRGDRSFRCRKCKKKFNYHDELKKHDDFCFLSDGSDSESSPVKSPDRKKPKIEGGDTEIAELVSTMKNTQNTLDKINELINAESVRFESG